MPCNIRPNLAERLDYLFGDAGVPTRINTALALAGAKLHLARTVQPWMLQVEVTNRCNINCAFCSRNVTEMRLGDMAPALRDKVVELSARVQEVALFGYGEPLVSRAFHDLLPRLRSSRVGFFTNGLLLDERLLGKLLEKSARPLSYIVFSVDGATAETYESIRNGSDFERVWRNLGDAAIVLRRMGARRPRLRIEFVAMKKNVAELPQLVRMADEAGVDVLKVSHLVVWNEGMVDQSLTRHPDLCRHVFAEAADEARDRAIHLDLPKIMGEEGGTHSPPPCRYPWHYAMISFEGEVRACCFAPVFLMGNLLEQDFGEIWNSKKYMQLRKTVNAASIPGPCRRCEERFRYVASPDEEQTYIKLTPRQK